MKIFLTFPSLKTTILLCLSAAITYLFSSDTSSKCIKSLKSIGGINQLKITFLIIETNYLQGLVSMQYLVDKSNSWDISKQTKVFSCLVANHKCLLSGEKAN